MESPRPPRRDLLACPESMNRSPQTLCRLPLLAVFVIAAVLLAGPLGLNASSALASTSGCDSSCPCDEEEHEESPAGVADADSGPGDDAPCEDERDGCPENCPDCGCGLGPVLGLSPLKQAKLIAHASTLSLVVASERPMEAKLHDVFRPPRSCA